MNKRTLINLWLTPILVLVFSLPQSLRAQELLSQQSLDLMEDEALLTLFNKYDRDSLRQEQIARTYLDRAMREGDTIKMARGYDRLARIFGHKKNLAFADSIIGLTGHMNHKTYPALAYMIKGFEYYQQDDLIKSTKNFINLYQLAKRNNNIPQQIFALDYLIFCKSTWGNKSEALDLQKERHAIISNPTYRQSLIESTRKSASLDIDQLWLRDRILSNTTFAFCYLKVAKLDSARIYLDKATKLVKSYNEDDFDELKKYLTGVQLEFLHLNREFNKIMTLVPNYLDEFKSNLTKQELDDIFFLLGHALISSGKREEGLNYYIKIDSALHNNNVSVRPYHREVLTSLLDLSRQKRDKASEIHYLNQLLYADSVYKNIYRYFEPGLIKNFETPKLLEQKQIVINSLENENKSKQRLTNWLLFGLLIATGTGGYYAYRQQRFKKRFIELQAQLSKAQPERKRNLEISAEITGDILQKLENFEASEQYLKQDITLHSLAEQFDTNDNYLSRIINFKLGKKFPDYLNDLRVAYALKRLSDDKRFRHYTIKAIAQSSGYRSADSFSRAFYKRHGIYPSYYLKKLEHDG